MSEILDNYKALAAERDWSDETLAEYLEALPAADLAAELRASAGIAATSSPIDRSASGPVETAAAPAPVEPVADPVETAAPVVDSPSIDL